MALEKKRVRANDRYDKHYLYYGSRCYELRIKRRVYIRICHSHKDINSIELPIICTHDFNVETIRLCRYTYLWHFVRIDIFVAKYIYQHHTTYIHIHITRDSLGYYTLSGIIRARYILLSWYTSLATPTLLLLSYIPVSFGYFYTPHNTTQYKIPHTI